MLADRAKALQNHLARDTLFTEGVKEQPPARNLKLLEVDGSLTLDEVVQMTAQHFGLPANTPA